MFFLLYFLFKKIVIVGFGNQFYIYLQIMKAHVLFLLLAFGTSQKAEDKRSQMMDWQ